jgi:hypothetical protein
LSKVSRSGSSSNCLIDRVILVFSLHRFLVKNPPWFFLKILLLQQVEEGGFEPWFSSLRRLDRANELKGFWQKVTLDSQKPTWLQQKVTIIYMTGQAKRKKEKKKQAIDN